MGKSMAEKFREQGKSQSFVDAVDIIERTALARGELPEDAAFLADIFRPEELEEQSVSQQ